MSIPETSSEAGEFKVLYGFTKDPERIALDALEFKGVVKVIPRAVGIYRTGDRLALLLTIARAMGRESYPGGEVAAPRPADVAPDTEGTPEHLIDPKRTTVLHDERRQLIILQVPGRTHFVLKARRNGLTPAEEVERELLDALERCTQSKAQPVVCGRDFVSSWPLIAAVAAGIVLLLVLLIELLL
jgi:hypothetical protein